MSTKYLKEVTVHNQSLNIRCNDLTVDGQFIHSGGSTDFWTVVSTYADLLAEIAAGMTRLAIVSDLTATANLPLTAGIEYIFYIDASLNMGDFIITLGSSGTNVTFYGKGNYANDVGLTWTPTTGHHLFTGDSASTTLTFNDIAVLNNSSVANTLVCGNGNVRFFNASYGAFSLQPANGFQFVDNTSMAVNSYFSNCNITASTTNLFQGCTFSLANLTLLNAEGARLMGCFFDDATITINNTCTDTVVCGCYKTAAGTVTDNGVTSRKAANNF